VQLVLTNLGVGAFGMHPVHLHGFSFHVLHIEYPPVFNDTGTVCQWPEGDPHPTCKSSDKVACVPGTGCAVAGWAGPAGSGPPAGMLNFNRPPRKNTVVVPAGGFAVVRFRVDNPGMWHLHCHMADHLASGMGMILNAAPELQPQLPPPAGFPRCGNLRDSESLAEHVASSRQRWEAMLLGGAAAV
jgi:FtsP/CotA-like multicopper oxidase with cupredoxin domain